MLFVDFHTHIYPDKIAKKATSYLTSHFGEEASWPASSENLLIFGKAAGISRFVVLPVAQKVEQVRKINDFVISENNEHIEYYAFGTIHVALDNICGEIDYIKNNGLYGVKIHPDQQGFEMDDPRLFDAYRYLEELQLPVLFHCGDPVSDFSHPLRLKKILRMFPRLRVVAAHFGGWRVFDEALEILKGENCFFDLSSSMSYLGKEKTAKFINTYGEDKVFFGTDFPLWGQDEEIERFLSLPISDSAKEKIAGLNALSFLGQNISSIEDL